MKLGILLASRRLEEIPDRLKQAREAGFTLCQVNLHQAGLTRNDLVTLADQFVDHHVRPAAIGCYVNPLRPNDAFCGGICREDLDLLLHSLDIIGARRVILWSGTYADDLQKEHPANGSEDGLEVLRSFVTDIVRTTRARHYFLVIEPWRGHVLNGEARIRDFHARLEPDVAAHVRYVLDATHLLTAEHYPNRDAHARSVCESLGELAGLVHLKDCVLSSDGHPAMSKPGRGTLDYTSYLQAIFQSVASDVPAIVCNVSPDEYSTSREYLCSLSDRWDLCRGFEA